MGGLHSRGAFEQTQLLRFNELAALFIAFTYDLSTFERSEFTTSEVSITVGPE